MEFFQCNEKFVEVGVFFFAKIINLLYIWFLKILSTLEKKLIDIVWQPNEW